MNYIITLYRDNKAADKVAPVQRFNSDNLTEAYMKYGQACMARFATKVELSVILDTWSPPK